MCTSATLTIKVRIDGSTLIIQPMVTTPTATIHERKGLTH